jgi:ArsR family transcriptional regulator, arsenate/arsenite/antimonite-responsive transcriptional repressor
MKTSEVIDALAALAHEHRLAIFRLLVETGPEGLPAGEIGQRVGLVPSSLTFHLQHLARAGLLTQRRVGRQLFYATNFGVMNALVAYLTENCCGGAGCAPARPDARSGRTLRDSPARPQGRRARSS